MNEGLSELNHREQIQAETSRALTGTKLEAHKSGEISRTRRSSHRSTIPQLTVLGVTEAGLPVL
jgi:hypothetical protein